MSKLNPAKRRKARRLALQAIYQWQLTKDDVAVIESQFFADDHFSKVDVDYFRELMQVPNRVSELDQLMVEFLDRPFEQLDLVELAILRMALYELLARIDVPYRVIINEALELAKLFGATDSYKYINGILDQAAKLLRTQEIS